MISRASEGEEDNGEEEMKSPSTESPRHIVKDGEELRVWPLDPPDADDPNSVSKDAPGLKVMSEDGVIVPEDDVLLEKNGEVAWFSTNKSCITVSGRQEDNSADSGATNGSVRVSNVP